MELNDLKREYNYWIERNRKAEKYFKENTVDKCEKWLPLFNEITVKLSNLRKTIESRTKREMSKYEILNGFKEVA